MQLLLGRQRWAVENSGFWRPHMFHFRVCPWEGLFQLLTLAASFLSVPSPSLSSPPHPLCTSAALSSFFPEPLPIYSSTAVERSLYSFFSELKLLLSEKHTFMQTIFQIRLIKCEIHLSNIYYTLKSDYWNDTVNLVTGLNILITC